MKKILEVDGYRENKILYKTFRSTTKKVTYDMVDVQCKCISPITNESSDFHTDMFNYFIPVIPNSIPKLILLARQPLAIDISPFLKPNTIRKPL